MIGFFLGVAAQNGPAEASSNLKAWLNLAGINSAPSTVFGVPLDTAGLMAALLVVVVSLIWFFWPDKSNTKFLGYMTPYEVIIYLANSTAWGAKVRAWRGYAEFKGQRIEARKSAMDEAFEEFQSKAQQPTTKIKAWGLKDGKGEPVEIPPSFWITNGFHFTDTISGMPSRTAPTVHRSYEECEQMPRYSDIRVERWGVERTWRRIWNPVAFIREKRRRKAELDHLAKLGFK